MIETAKYYLHPSKLIVSKEPIWVSTVLGSCVAVCLYDSEKQIGGINHFMLPLWNGEGLETPRYGNIAIIKLIEELTDIGAERKKMIAKVFGGGNVLGEDSSLFKIGERNVGLALKLLGENNIPVIASSTGGNRGRKILFNTFTGKVLQQYINPK